MIELSRNVTLGQYIPNGSVINRLDARVKILALVVLIIMISLINHFAAYLVCLGLAAVLLLAAWLPLGFILNSFRPALIFLIFIDIFQVLFYQGSGPQLILWHWGIFTISRQGLLFTADISMRVLFLYLFVNLLTYTTSLVDLADGTESLLTPLRRIGLPVQEGVMVMVIALKFVPILITELERTIKAQTARGVRFDKGNFIHRATKIGALLVPLILTALQRGEQLAVSMDLRCYRGGKGRTKMRVMRLRMGDVLAALVLLAMIVGVLFVEWHAPW